MDNKEWSRVQTKSGDGAGGVICWLDPSVCVCACVRACVCACVCVCVL